MKKNKDKIQADIDAAFTELEHAGAFKDSVDADTDYILDSIRMIADTCMNKTSKEAKVCHTGKRKFNPHAALKALELLGRYKKMFSDRLEMDLPGKTPVNWRVEIVRPGRKKTT